MLMSSSVPSQMEPMFSSRRLAVDVGGTFIDFVTLDPDTGAITIEKVRSAGALDEHSVVLARHSGYDHGGSHDVL